MTDELISKTDVVKIVKSVLSPASSLTNVARARRQMLNEINELESKPEPHWIPVTERLPKKDGSYLVSGKWESGKESVGDCEFSVEDGYFQTAWNFDVLAWYELPEPYKVVTK